jgi:hypothetical protein
VNPINYSNQTVQGGARQSRILDCLLPILVIFESHKNKLRKKWKEGQKGGKPRRDGPAQGRMLGFLNLEGVGGEMERFGIYEERFTWWWLTVCVVVHIRIICGLSGFTGSAPIHINS